jgi:pilus assembly protein CpaF
MLPQRPGTATSPTGPAPSGERRLPGALPPGQTFEAVKRRVLARLEARLDLSASRRMPASLLRQSLLQQAEQMAEQEGRGLSRPERDRVVEEVLGDLLGYGPLEELFRDAAVREIMVAGPGAVIVRREEGHWLPTSVKFRDEGHVRATLDKMAAHAEPVGPVTASVAMFDLRLPNGFRALAVIPPEALGQPATAAFVREIAREPEPGIHPALLASASASAGTMRPTPSAITADARPGATSLSRSGAVEVPAERDPVARYRQRILERLLKKMASLGVYDVQRVEAAELRRVIAAYTDEFCQTENIYLSETDRGRVVLEILTSLGR